MVSFIIYTARHAQTVRRILITRVLVRLVGMIARGFVKTDIIVMATIASSVPKVWFAKVVK